MLLTSKAKAQLVRRSIVMVDRCTLRLCEIKDVILKSQIHGLICNTFVILTFDVVDSNIVYKVTKVLLKVVLPPLYFITNNL